MVFDFDDYCEDNHRLDLLNALHDANPEFRCTLFAIPGRGSQTFWDQTPDWCELAVHGWTHPTPHEAEDWPYERAVAAMVTAPDGFAHGFKAPGWQISQGTYEAIQDRGWWVADHYDNDSRRPDGIIANVISRTASHGADPNHWHGHIGNSCGNGIEETFLSLLGVVRGAESFEFISEVVEPWHPRKLEGLTVASGIRFS